MGFFKLVSVSVLALGLATASHAQSLKNSRGPANLPPASFKGPQFVDNRGCIFIRAGRGGNVNWVPRVSRDRKQICGLQPTFANTRVATPAPKTTTRVVKGPAPTTRVVRAPKPATRVVRAPAPTTRVVRHPKKVVRTVRAPKPQVQTAPAGSKVTRCKVSALSAKYMNKNGVRCGPQATSPRSVVGQTSQLRGPKGANRKIREARTIHPPKGYAAAWDDGRLNPLRGVGTTSGKAQMNLIWSQTVPRYLIDPATGKPATKRQIRLFGG